MTNKQIIFKVIVPLAAPVLIALIFVLAVKGHEAAIAQFLATNIKAFWGNKANFNNFILTFLAVSCFSAITAYVVNKAK